jgi:hypothetical protein
MLVACRKLFLAHARPWSGAALALGCLLSAAATAHPGSDFGFASSGEGGYFLRGDSNQDGKVNLADAVFTLGFLFSGTDIPYCVDAMDADDNGELLITDPIFTLGVLFLGRHALPPPFPDPGMDPTDDRLDCDNGAFAHIRREILVPSCATAFCHSSKVAAGSLDLEGDFAYSQLYLSPVTSPFPRAAGMVRVRPGSPESSFFYQVITEQVPAEQFLHMPKPTSLLDHDQIALIEHWIRDGALPSTARDISLPPPVKGQQIVIPPFSVLKNTEVQRNYSFKLNNSETLWVNRIEFLSPPGIDHWNLFTWLPGTTPPSRENGFDDKNFALVTFRDWSLRASNQSERLDWRLPQGVGMQLAPFQQTLSQIHYVNTDRIPALVGGSAAINLHALDFTPGNPPAPLGCLIVQDRSIRVPPQSTVSWDYGITFSALNHPVPVKLAAVQGHFHWRGKSFEMRIWDGLNKNADGSPAAGEFDRMGPANTVYFSDNFEAPPFISFGDDGPEVPPGSGVVFRSTFVNTSTELYCFGSRAEFHEHSIAFIYFYPGPIFRSGFLWFPPECLGQGCTVQCPNTG